LVVDVCKTHPLGAALLFLFPCRAPHLLYIISITVAVAVYITIIILAAAAAAAAAISICFFTT
jgi:hypothetical protein